MPRFSWIAVAFVVAFALAACTGDADAPAGATATSSDGESGALVVYAGRKQALVDDAVGRFRDATGVDVEVRYGSDAELLAAMAEEGDRSPADVFWANTAGALGAAAERFAELPDSLLARPGAFVPSGGRWLPVTTRFRVLAYRPGDIDAATLPASILDLPAQSALSGRIGWTPTYSSFQDFVTALRITEGAAAAEAWVAGVRALEPKAYASNTPMLEALAAGEIDVALTNHYYVLRVTEAAGGAPPVATHRFAPGDVGNLALVTGAGVLDTAENTANAHRFLAYLLSDTAQADAAASVYEYPVVADVTAPDYLLPFTEARALSPEIDFEQLRDIEATLGLLRDQDLL